MATIGQKIRELREKRGMDQETLATKAGVTQAYISRVEKGRNNPTVPVLQKIAKALGVVNYNYFFEQPDEKNIPMLDLLDHLDPEDKKFLIMEEAKGYITVSRELAEHGISANDLRSIVNILKSSRK